jgi:hypothetical protein
VLTAQFANVVCAVLVVYAIVAVAHPKLRMSPWAHGFASYLALLTSFSYMAASRLAEKPQLLGVAMLTAAVAVGYVIAGILAFSIRRFS